jgi:hypothetical protein
MPDTPAEQNGATATLTAQPPAPPSAPPKTGVGAPGPDRKGGRGCLLAGLAVALVAGLALGGFVVWALMRPSSAPNTQPAAGPFASAMKKAGVSAPAAPAAPVNLVSVKAVGSHPFDATFSLDELTALLRSFAYAPTSGTQFNIAVDSVSQQRGGSLRIAGKVTSGGTSYNGWVQGPVQFSGGQITRNGAPSANAEGIDVSGAQAEQAASVLIDYLNGYLAAAPGLKVDSATITTDGVHVTGTAPDRITW